jgi:hypothetical protein
MGSMGDIVGDMTSFTHTDFRSHEKANWSLSTDSHGGGDWRLTANWVQAVDQHNPDLLTSSIDVSIESHIMCFSAEHSRLGGKIADVLM